MPELPEVETVVRTLASRVAGSFIHAVSHVRHDMVTPARFDIAPALTGRSVLRVTRRAKRIVFTLDTQERFYIHLGMTGRLTIEAPDAPLRKHTHLILDLGDTLQIRLVDPRRFGAIVWLGLTDHARIGPEPLLLSPKQFAARLARTRRAIKTALLDQTVVAGVGNIYADEALHRARIHPSTPACALSDTLTRALNRSLKFVLNRAIKAGGSSIRDYVNAAGERGAFQMQHAVYDRACEPCRTCRETIVRIVLGGRSTHYCPKCQSE